MTVRQLLCKVCEAPLPPPDPSKKKKQRSRCDACIKADPKNGLWADHKLFHHKPMDKSLIPPTVIPPGVIDYLSERPEWVRETTMFNTFDDNALKELCNKVATDFMDVGSACDNLGLDTAEVMRTKTLGAEHNADAWSFMVWNSLRFAESEAIRILIARSQSGDVVLGNQARDHLEKTNRRLSPKHSINVTYEVSAIASAVDHVIRLNLGRTVTLQLLSDISDVISRLNSDAVIMTLDERLLSR